MKKIQKNAARFDNLKQDFLDDKKYSGTAEATLNGYRYDITRFLKYLSDEQLAVNRCKQIPLFIKKPSWAFEREYRMFLLKHRSTREETLASQDYLDSNGNINLSDAVTAIYLGQNFENNQNAPQLRAQIISICREKSIPLFQKQLKNGHVTNKLLL